MGCNHLYKISKFREVQEKRLLSTGESARSSPGLFLKQTVLKQDWKGVIHFRIHTHMFFANSELLLKDYVSYLTYTTLVSNYTNNVVLMSPLRYVNQQK
jgi:hypothetical protein